MTPTWLSPTQKALFSFFQSVPCASTADALRAVPGARSSDVRRMQTQRVLISAPSPGRGNMLRLADQWQRHTPNASSYYVWVVMPNGVPLTSEGPYGPHPLKESKQLARIGATNGAHDRAVTLGRDPGSDSFKIVRLYRRRTGERVL